MNARTRHLLRFPGFMFYAIYKTWAQWRNTYTIARRLDQIQRGRR